MNLTKLQKRDLATRDVVYKFIEDFKAGILNFGTRMSDEQYCAYVSEYGYPHYVNDREMREKVAWTINRWVTKKARAKGLRRKDLTAKMALAFVRLCEKDKTPTYSQLFDFVVGCVGKVDSKQIGTIASLVNYKLAEEDMSPLVGYNEVCRHNVVPRRKGS